VEGVDTRRRQLAWLNGLRAGLALMLALAGISAASQPAAANDEFRCLTADCSG